MTPYIHTSMISTSMRMHMSNNNKHISPKSSEKKTKPTESERGKSKQKWHVSATYNKYDSIANCKYLTMQFHYSALWISSIYFPLLLKCSSFHHFSSSSFSLLAHFLILIFFLLLFFGVFLFFFQLFCWSVHFILFQFHSWLSYNRQKRIFFFQDKSRFPLTYDARLFTNIDVRLTWLCVRIHQTVYMFV